MSIFCYFFFFPSSQSQIVYEQWLRLISLLVDFCFNSDLEIPIPLLTLGSNKAHECLTTEREESKEVFILVPLRWTLFQLPCYRNDFNSPDSFWTRSRPKRNTAMLKYTFFPLCSMETPYSLRYLIYTFGMAWKLVEDYLLANKETRYGQVLLLTARPLITPTRRQMDVESSDVEY